LKSSLKVDLFFRRYTAHEHPTFQKSKKSMDDLVDDLDTEPVQATTIAGPCPFDRFPRDILGIILEYARGAAINRVCKTWRSFTIGKGSISYNLCDFARSPESVLWYERESGKVMEDLCYHAARLGYLSTLQWAHENNYPWDSRVCQEAAKRGDLAMLRWAWSETAPIDNAVYAEAAGHGHRDILDWMHSIDPDLGPSNYAWICIARGNQLDIAKWMYASRDSKKHKVHWGSVSEAAAEARNIDFLNWLIEVGVGQITYRAIIYAAAQGRADFVLKYFPNKALCFNEDVKCSTESYLAYTVLDHGAGVMQAACSSNNLDLVKALHAMGCPWSFDISSRVASRGDFTMLKWTACECAAGNPEVLTCPITTNTLKCAVSSGNTEMVDWLIRNYRSECNFSFANGRATRSDLIELAATNGDIPMIKMLMSHKVVFSTQTVYLAVAAGRVSTVKWLREGCVRDGTTNKPAFWDHGVSMAALEKNYTIFHWLIEHGCPVASGPLCVAARCLGNMEAAKLVEKQCGCSWECENELYRVIENHKETALKIAAEYGYVMSTVMFAQICRASAKSPSSSFWAYVRDNLVPHYFPTIKNMNAVVTLCHMLSGYTGGFPDVESDLAHDVRSSDEEDDSGSEED
jgi:hypothetical protein